MSFELESAQLALQDSEDYKKLMRHIALLEALKLQALQDLDTLRDEKQKALSKPFDFIKRLQAMETSLPGKLTVPKPPHIDWQKYAIKGVKSRASKKRPNTRRRKLHTPGAKEFKPLAKDAIKLPSDMTFVRGRIKDSSKPDTFNKLWTSEEQRQLEALLVKYPAEEVEAHRYQKIANEMKNRTYSQVASRIQKYFIRLAKAGLPVPGKMPNLMLYKKKGKSRGKGSAKGDPNSLHSMMAASQSTMLQSYVPPVFMAEDDDDDDDDMDFEDDEKSFDGISSVADDLEDITANIPKDKRSGPEYAELVRLVKLKKRKIQEQISGGSVHMGYSCDGCSCEPIVGVRWHCEDCPEDNSVDLCDSCYSKRDIISVPGHPSTHSWTKATPSESLTDQKTVDADYLSSKFNVPGSYNYLDPNYLPAS